MTYHKRCPVTHTSFVMINDTWLGTAATNTYNTRDIRRFGVLLIDRYMVVVVSIF